MTRLQGKVAVITGGTSGIGAATAERFISEGCKVVIAGRSVEKGNALADRLGANALFVETDVTCEGDIAHLMQQAVARFGRLDILFNNAGAPARGDLENITQQSITDSLQLLLGSVILGMKHAIPHLKANGGGVIINNASVAGIRHGQGSLIYSAAKAAVTHYTKLAGVELGPHCIRVNSISPGGIATPIFWGGSAQDNGLSAQESARKLEKLSANLAHAAPLPTAGYPDDIANGALFLASDEGRFVTSHDLVIDGGRTAMFNEKPR